MNPIDIGEANLLSALADLRQVIHEDMTHAQQKHRHDALSRADFLLETFAKARCEDVRIYENALGRYWTKAMKETKR